MSKLCQVLPHSVHAKLKQYTKQVTATFTGISGSNAAGSELKAIPDAEGTDDQAILSLSVA